MFGILDRYIGRVIFMSILLCEVTLVGLSALIKYVEQLKSVGDGNYDMVNAFYFVMLSMPKEAVLFFPLAALLGGLIGLGQLASSSELVVMQAAGRSKLSIVIAALKTAIPLMLVFSLVGEYVAPIAKRTADDIKAGAMSEGRLTVSASGVWARDGNNFVSINGVRNDGALTGITLYRFTPDRKLIDVVQAQEGMFEQHHWLLKSVHATRFDDPTRIISEVHPQMTWTSDLTPKQLGVVSIDPENLSISGLRDYVGYLDANKQDAGRYKLELWRKLLAPLSVVSMILLASSFIFGPLRSVSMGARMLMGIMTGFVVYVSDRVFGPISLVYAVPPIIAAVAPSLLFGGISLYILSRRR
ncbi:LPS export ABC transporter permease LptG [Aeromonas rivuli]|jgi:lipopolysaccharide export system permease protein|uniref:LPS export ABC transporter permease LptG n=1 Tax=Aeromonas TaxID=642 RepID=UPI0005A82C4B|nr:MULTISPECIES: LPS export ABC transporter permease LptG [Aeromonas]MCS3460476.1 lipopolysaccharide export system permease protein [Aeromonas sp. BIGb0445]